VNQRLAAQSWKIKMDSAGKKEFIHEIIATNAAKMPRQTAIYDRDRIITYAELFDGVQSLSVWLEEHYPQKIRVGILLNNGYEMVRALYAVSKAGLISVPLDADMHARNISYIVDDCGIKIILTADKYLPQLNKIEAHQDFDLLRLDNPDHEWPYPSDGKKRDSRSLLGIQPVFFTQPAQLVREKGLCSATPNY